MNEPQDRQSQEAITCTIELSTGSFLEISETPESVMVKRNAGLAAGLMVTLQRLTGTNRSDADYRQMVFIDPAHIVAVYPLDEMPIPPRRVYVDRIEASTG